MQRLSDKSRKKGAEIVEPPPPTVKSPRTYSDYLLSSSIIFLLSSHDQRIASLINLNIKARYKDMMLGDMHNEKALEYKHTAPFNYRMRFFKNAKKIKFALCRKLYLSYLNGMRFEELCLDSLCSINTEDTDKIEVFMLRLENMQISAEDFISLISHCKPAALVLKNVGCGNLTPDTVWRMCRAMVSLRLLSLEVSESFLDFGSFKKIIVECEIFHFSFIYDKIKLAYKVRTPLLGFCLTDRSLAFLGKDNFRHIEAIHIASAECEAFLAYEMPMLKYLSAEDITIDPSFIRALGPLRGIAFTNCTFKNLCFYELMRKIAKTLKFISFDRTEIPLDSYLFLREVLLGCQVVITGSISFYIKN